VDFLHKKDGEMKISWWKDPFFLKNNAVEGFTKALGITKRRQLRDLPGAEPTSTWLKGGARSEKGCHEGGGGEEYRDQRKARHLHKVLP